MNNIEVLNRYDFHDSLIDSCTYSKTNKTVSLEIDLCYWKQSWYNDVLPETGMITLIFHNVKNEIVTDAELNSDEIISFKYLSDGESVCGVRFVVLNDKENDVQNIDIFSQTVSVIVNK